MPRRDSQREDYLLRIIREAADALRRLRKRLTASAGAAAAVREESRVAVTELLGEQASLLTRLDADSAARLIGNKERVELWADLVELDADACVALGDTASEATYRARASAIRAAAKKLNAESDSHP